MLQESPTDRRGQRDTMAVDVPSRDSDSNQHLIDSGEPATDKVLFPTLEDGITVLEVETGRGVPVLQSLVIDHLLMHPGPAFWVDANGHATTTSLARIVPSQRLLGRIHVARGFTGFQHYGAISDLPSAINETIQRTARTTSNWDGQSESQSGDETTLTPSLIVAPAIDSMYREDDALSTAHGQTLLSRALAQLRTYTEGYDIPVLVTKAADDDFGDIIRRAANQTMACEQTRMGPRFVSDGFETLIYPVHNGQYYQTTISYWRQLLGTRARQAGREVSHPDQTASRTVGDGITIDGPGANLSTDPLLDAWTNAADAGVR